MIVDGTKSDSLTGQDLREWSFLVGETLVGERYIVRELVRLLRNELPEKIRSELHDQLDDEIRHVRMYSVFDLSRFSGTGYEREFEKSLKQLSVGEKLYALRVVLEGAALGMLRFRCHFWPGSASAEVDRQVLSDEMNHTSFSAEAISFIGQSCDGTKLRRNFESMLGRAFSADRLALAGYPASSKATLRTRSEDLRKMAQNGIAQAAASFARNQHDR